MRLRRGAVHGMQVSIFLEQIPGNWKNCLKTGRR